MPTNHYEAIYHGFHAIEVEPFRYNRPQITTDTHDRLILAFGDTAQRPPLPVREAVLRLNVWPD